MAILWSLCSEGHGHSFVLVWYISLPTYLGIAEDWLGTGTGATWEWYRHGVEMAWEGPGHGLGTACERHAQALV